MRANEINQRFDNLPKIIILLTYSTFHDPSDNGTSKTVRVFMLRKSRDPHKRIMYNFRSFVCVTHDQHCVFVPLSEREIFIVSIDLVLSGRFGE